MSALLKPTLPAVDLGSARAAAAALRTFFRLAEAWNLSGAEQMALLGVARATLYQWKQGKVGPLDRHLLERLSHLFGIYSSLQILFPAPGRGDNVLFFSTFTKLPEAEYVALLLETITRCAAEQRLVAAR